LRPRIALALTGALSVAAMAVGSSAVAQAAVSGHPAAVKNVCSHLVPAKYLQPGTTRYTRPSSAELAAIAKAKMRLDKARHDTEAAQIRRLAAAAKAHDAHKWALLRAGRAAPRGAASLQCAGLGRANYSPNSLVGSGYSYINWMFHYTQINGYFCGPASVEEVSATVPGPSPLGLPQPDGTDPRQSQFASDMGTTSNNGTDFGAMVTELNSVVGVPDFGWNYYVGVWMDYNPTDAQRTEFITDLKGDVANNTPVVGNALEVYGGPHLVGNPNTQTDIGHYVAIGGWNDNTGQVWYADSAQNVWFGANVPDYSWISTYDMETILGGRGFIW
jgi:hypothetical protein